MRRIPLCSSVVALAGLLTAASAQAQTPASGGISPPPPENSSTATAQFSSASSTRGRGLGIGAATMLNGTSGALVTWGMGGFHLDGLVGLHRYTAENSTTAFTVAGRGWYHLHAASFADFSLGGGIGLVRWVDHPGVRNQQDTHWDVTLELGAQIRAFIVPNVALLADLGVGMTFANNDDILVGGQSVAGSSAPGGSPNFIAGTLGIAYFFE